ncbi:MAG: methyltransferase [Burkholderiaceae bacterium]|nr:methyltransferase [Burkholderiaceae bacterium]MCX8003717.1 methyltransferase [Burkholderiaceae bacterium]
MGAVAIGAATLRQARNRLLGSPAFQRLAARLPLARGIARRRARALFDLCAGFVYSQILYACVRLRMLQQLQAGPLDTARLAQRCGLPLEGAQRLLAAASALRLVERAAGERWALGPLGAALLANAGALAMIEHHALLYADLADPVALLREPGQPTRLARFWGYARAPDAAALTEAEVAAYGELMAVSQQLIADEVLDAYPLHWHDAVLDVGGGEGVFLATALRRAPRLRGLLFDLPAVVARAQRRLQREGLQARVALHGGDFLRDELPAGADLVTLVRVLHDHDDEAVLQLLQRVHRALPPHGTLLIAEPLADTPQAAPMGAAYFGFYLLAMGRGRPRTRAQIDALLRAGGFGGVTALPTRYPLQTSVLIAHRR